MRAIIHVLDLALGLYMWVLIASAVVSWLVAFDVINRRNDTVRGLLNFLYQVTEPVLRPIRRILPNLGGVDISPVIVILLILLVRMWLQDLEVYVARNYF